MRERKPSECNVNVRVMMCSGKSEAGARVEGCLLSGADLEGLKSTGDFRGLISMAAPRAGEIETWRS